MQQKHGLRYDAEWLRVVTAKADEAAAQSGDAGTLAVKPEWEDVFELRAFSESMLGAMFRAAPYPEEVTETKIELARPDGTGEGGTFTLSRFATAEQRGELREGEGLRSANIHGGGFICCNVEIFAPEIARSVASQGVQHFAVDYPNAPEHPAPAAVNTCYAALEWLSAHAREMHIDPSRIVVVGDSAGGGIAAGTVLMARDKGLDPPVAKQVLIYPMLDDRTHYPDDWPGRTFLTWKAEDNVMGWSAYVGEDKRGREEADVSYYAAPARAESLEGLPSTYIDVGGLDLFRDENIRFAQRLAEAHVEVEFHLYPGVPHGFESGLGAWVVGRARENRIRAIQVV
ncbi:alpha/beta hydrolase fold-domain-containing protein [Coniochaeta sp. 2T2.1]|nr:alpha/beta hydrolase fold-domain-containing protein [Coniochaeta sp. 2T2.1]